MKFNEENERMGTRLTFPTETEIVLALRSPAKQTIKVKKDFLISAKEEKRRKKKAREWILFLEKKRKKFRKKARLNGERFKKTGVGESKSVCANTKGGEKAYVSAWGSHA